MREEEWELVSVLIEHAFEIGFEVDEEEFEETREDLMNIVNDFDSS